MEGFSLGAVAGACPGAAAAAVGAVASRREKGVSVAAVAAGNREVVGLEAAVEEEVVGRRACEGLGRGRVRREGAELEVGRVRGWGAREGEGVPGGGLFVVCGVVHDGRVGEGWFCDKKEN